MSGKVQYIIVFVILAAIIVWLVYSLLRKKEGTRGACGGCSLAETCAKKKLVETTGRKPGSCGDCPSTRDCEKKNTFLSCGGGGKSDSDDEQQG